MLTEMIIINCTGHDVHIYNAKCRMTNGNLQPNSKPIISFKKDNTIRASTIISNFILDIDGIEVPAIARTTTVDMPEYKENVRYIVSSMTAEAIKKSDRTTLDLLVPDRLIKSNGVILGCLGFAFV